MARKWESVILAVTLLASVPAYAQDDSNAAASGGATSGTAAPATPADQTAPGAEQTSGAGTPAPNAPIQAEGPLPAGDEAGTQTAAHWSPGPATIAVGAAVVAGAICLAVCGGSGHGSTSSTTTTTPK
jgi:hypothetical protein